MPSREMLRAGRNFPGALLVGEGGLEPPHPFEYRHLKPARLPIPPLARMVQQHYSTLTEWFFAPHEGLATPVQLILLWRCET